MEKCWLLDEGCSGIDCNTFCLKRYKLEKLFDMALLTQKQREKIKFKPDSDKDKENFEYLSTINKNINNFVNQGGNLYIYSPLLGNGKTSWSLRFIQTYLKNIWYTSELKCRALFINVPRFLLALKATISEKDEYAEYIKSNVLEADLVVWDEIGTKGLTQFEHENILSFINARVDAGKANVYTSNLNGKELCSVVGDRLYSRVVLLSDRVELNGSDRRAL